MIDVFIPSYHRPNNIKTAMYLRRIGYEMGKVHVFVDDEADDIEEYRAACKGLGCHLHVFDMAEARRRFDYVHRASVSRRSAGQARNMFQDFAKENGIDFYLVMDDDTTGFQKKKRGLRSYNGKPTPDEIFLQMWYTEHFMRRRHIGVFAWLQTGDFIGGENAYLYRPKVMNTTFYLLPYIYRGERGVQDDDTSQFVGILNRGLFTGSYGCGCVLEQMPSATQKGGLTDLYNECKLLNKALVTPIQYPSAIKATRQKKNGARLHHLISYRYLMPKILKIEGGRDNIAWDTYEEDWPFTNEPKRRVENGK